VINAILEDTLPADLRSMDQTLPRIPPDTMVLLVIYFLQLTAHRTIKKSKCFLWWGDNAVGKMIGLWAGQWGVVFQLWQRQILFSPAKPSYPLWRSKVTTHFHLVLRVWLGRATCKLSFTYVFS
jgi:hypothetical protein